MTAHETIIPYGFCHCGCGQKTNIAKKTRSKLERGKPSQYLRYHYRLTKKDIERVRSGRMTHGHTSFGDVSPTYNSWRAMLGRCGNPNSEKYPTYGARGINVCERWQTFANFLADMGERPTGKTLDRFPNNNGNYELGNCRWATPQEQRRNGPHVRWVLYKGERMPLTYAAKQMGMSATTLSRRLEKGWMFTDLDCQPPNS